MTRVLDSNGVQLTRGVLVSQPLSATGTREGVVAATVGLSGVLVVWEGAENGDDEYIEAATLTTVSAIHERHRR